MKVLLFGGAGMLASDIKATAPQASRIVGLDRHQCDVTDPSAVERAIDTERPNLIINTSAYTAVDRAEVEQAAANAVNAIAVGKLGALAAVRGTPIVHFSTDYIFSGEAAVPYSEEVPPGPVNAYGESKLLGETLLAESGARALVLRTQWLFGQSGRSFARTMWERARARQPTRVVDDQWGLPTYTRDLALATWALILAGATGTVHAVGSGEPTTWFAFAKHIFAHAGVGELVSPCPTSDYPTAARRPAYSVLASHRLRQLIGTSLPPWRSGVDRFLAQLAASSDVEGA